MDIQALKAALLDVASTVSYVKATQHEINGQRILVRPSTLVALAEAAEAQLKILEEGK